MNPPDFPDWAGGFHHHFNRFQAATKGSLHQLEVLASPGIPSWRLAQQDPAEFSRVRQWSLRLTFWSFLWQVANAGASCRDAVRQTIALCSGQEQSAPTDDTSAYCQARQKLPVERLEEIHRHLFTDAQALVRQGDLWCGKRVRVIDGTTVGMPDTAKNQAVYPQASTQAPGCGFPVARILASFCLATGMIMQRLTGHWYQHELSLLPELLESFASGDVLLADRGFGNFPVLVQCLQRKLDGVFRANTAQRRVDFRLGKRLGKADRLVVWKKGVKPRYFSAPDWDALPENLTVRVVRVSTPEPGFRTRSILLVTTLLDPVAYPATELGRLYLRRWEMELCFRHLKTTLQMEFLSCKSPAMVDRELRLHFLVHNLIRRVALEGARKHLVPVQRISFAGTVAAVSSFSEAFLRVRGQRKRDKLRDKLYELITADLVPDRPGRREPRAVKRRPKNYPLLNRPRHIYKEIPHRNRYRRPGNDPGSAEA